MKLRAGIYESNSPTTFIFKRVIVQNARTNRRSITAESLAAFTSDKIFMLPKPQAVCKTVEA